MVGEPVVKLKKPIILQPRDEMIMLLVAEFRCLSREQLQVLLDFPCVTRINIRLKKLFDHGYLSRLLLPTTTGRPKMLYYLGSRGITAVSESLGINPSLLIKERKHLPEKAALFLNHQLFLNEVRAAFTWAMRNQPQMALERWIKERDCLVEFQDGQRKFTSLRPDGCLCLTYQGKRYSYFLEVDRSTMTNSRLRDKANAYLDYARSGHSLQDFGFQYFRVLIITKTEERLTNLKSTIGELTDRLFYFTSQNQIAHSSILDRIWQRVGRQDRFFLLEG